MKKVRNKLALLGGSCVILTFLLLILVFNISMQVQMKSRVIQAMESVLQWEWNEEEAPLYYAEVIAFQNAFEKVSGEGTYSRKEEQLLEWCRNHYSDGLQRAHIGVRTLYVTAQREQESKYGLVSYIDITGEPEMIRLINMLFLAAALIAGLAGVAGGSVLGKQMEKNELSQKRFFENTSHELKTPLTIIRGYVEGMELGVISERKKTCRLIEAQVDRISRLVEDILTMSRIESRAIVLRKEKLEVSELIQDCLMPFERMISERQLRIELDLQSGSVYGDLSQLEHAITNLLSNAIQYAKTTIRISCDSKQVCIWNDSVAVSQEELRHLFDRFYTGKNGNTGIGLALAKEVIELHNWKISAENSERGIRFRICFKNIL